MRPHQPRHRGIALLLVVMIMAIASIMAYALLNNAATQEQVAANQANAAEADALAESGVETAMYYLQNPKNAPARVAATATIPAYWSGATNLSFTGMSGAASVTVAPSGATGLLWTITSTGTASGHGGSLSKTITATAQVNATYAVQQGLATNAAITIGNNQTITNTDMTKSAVSTTGAVTLSGSGQIKGNIATSSYHNTGGSWTPVTAVLQPAPPTNPVPTFTQVAAYGGSYIIGGITYSPQTYNNLLGFILNALLNPLGIYLQSAGNMSVSGTKTSNGPVYVPAGNLVVAAAGNLTIGPVTSGYPAVVTSGALQMGNGATVTINGLAYFAGGITGGNATSNVVVNGALLMDTGSFSSYNGKVSVTYNSTQFSVPNFASAAPLLTPQSVKLTSWSP
jgi:Tfp pilus assembly protein PilX